MHQLGQVPACPAPGPDPHPQRVESKTVVWAGRLLSNNDSADEQVDHERGVNHPEKPILDHAWELLVAEQCSWFALMLGAEVISTYLHLGSLLCSHLNFSQGRRCTCSGVPSTAMFFVTDNLIGNETILSEVHKRQGEIRTQSRAHQSDVELSLLLGGHS